jgi:hypothetical protein
MNFMVYTLEQEVHIWCADKYFTTIESVVKYSHILCTWQLMIPTEKELRLSLLVCNTSYHNVE